jgi:putative acetyltransferase
MIEIGQIETAEDCAAVKALVLEYVAWIMTQDPDAESAPVFEGLEAELDALPGIFGPPTGAFLLARREGEAVGCVALRQVEPGVAELKRMYVRPGQRGDGVGHQLVEAVIAAARAAGHRRIVLESYHTLTGAQRIYRALGFRDVPEPKDFPAKWHGRVVFMEMALG